MLPHNDARNWVWSLASFLHVPPCSLDPAGTYARNFENSHTPIIHVGTTLMQFMQCELRTPDDVANGGAPITPNAISDGASHRPFPFRIVLEAFGTCRFLISLAPFYFLVLRFNFLHILCFYNVLIMYGLKRPEINCIRCQKPSLGYFAHRRVCFLFCFKQEPRLRRS